MAQKGHIARGRDCDPSARTLAPDRGVFLPQYRLHLTCAALGEMALLAYSVRFGEPGGDFVIDLLDPLETKGVQMISRRESFDAAKTRVLQTSRKHNVAVDPILPDDEGSETHADLESDPSLFREHVTGPFFFARVSNRSKMARTLFGFPAK
jgi:hypothetical protein